MPNPESSALHVVGSDDAVDGETLRLLELADRVRRMRAERPLRMSGASRM
jgi:hypothetical protein